MLDLDDNNKVLGYANQDSDGLFYISEDETKSNRSGKKPRHWNTAMMAKISSLITKSSSAVRKNDNVGRNKEYIENGVNTSESVSDSVSDSVPGDESDESAKIGTYNIPLSNSKISDNMVVTSCKDLDSNPAAVWHRRLGHDVGVKAINLQLKKSILPRPFCASMECEDSTKGKFRHRFGGSLTKRCTIGHLHVDTKGKIETESVDGHKYLLTIIE